MSKSVPPIELAYNKFEPADGAEDNLAPLIFLHGLALTKKSWMDIPQELANGTKRTAYAIDANNHGDTKYTDNFSFEANVTDLLHFMDTMDISKAILIGHCMGGRTAVRAALRSPERIEKVVIEDMFTKNLPLDLAQLLWGFVGLWAMFVQSTSKDLNEKEAISFAVDLAYTRLSTGQIPLAPKAIAKDMGLELKKLENGAHDVPYNKAVILPALQAYEPSQMSEVSGQFEGPALFIYGGISPLAVGRQKEEIKKHFPNAEFCEVEGASHYVHAEKSQDFKETVLKFLLK